MTYRSISETFSFTRIVIPLRGASYVSPDANAALLVVAGDDPASSSRLASHHLDHHALHPVQLRYLG